MTHRSYIRSSLCAKGLSSGPRSGSCQTTLFQVSSQSILRRTVEPLQATSFTAPSSEAGGTAAKARPDGLSRTRISARCNSRFTSIRGSASWRIQTPVYALPMHHQLHRPLKYQLSHHCLMRDLGLVLALSKRSQQAYERAQAGTEERETRQRYASWSRRDTYNPRLCAHGRCKLTHAAMYASQ